MNKINAFSRVLNQKVKTRFFFMNFQLMDNFNMTAYEGKSYITEIEIHLSSLYITHEMELEPA